MVAQAKHSNNKTSYIDYKVFFAIELLTHGDTQAHVSMHTHTAMIIARQQCT